MENSSITIEYGPWFSAISFAKKISSITYKQKMKIISFCKKSNDLCTSLNAILEDVGSFSHRLLSRDIVAWNNKIIQWSIYTKLSNYGTKHLDLLIKHELTIAVHCARQKREKEHTNKKWWTEKYFMIIWVNDIVL